MTNQSPYVLLFQNSKKKLNEPFCVIFFNLEPLFSMFNGHSLQREQETMLAILHQ